MVKPFAMKYGEVDVIGKGVNSRIYDVSPNRIAKIPILDFPVQRKVEVEIQKMLFDRGYPVPRPYGIYRIEVSRESGSSFNLNGFFMEKIHGCDLEKMSEAGEDPERIKNLYDEAQGIVGDIGNKTGATIYSDYGLYPRNIMYDERNDRVVLVDFGNWKLGELLENDNISRNKLI